MKHPLLGVITRDGAKDEGVARIPHGEQTIEIGIRADEIPYNEAVDVAAAVARHLHSLDAKAKLFAASELTETYNNGWNEYEEAQEDGTFKTLSNPKLTQDEFASKLTLRSIIVTGDVVDLFYDDENMFWGHSVVVTSMDGVAFTDTYAEVFG